MNDEMDPERDDSLEAGEYVLHLLSPADRAAFEARLDIEGALRAEVAMWSESFAGLARDLPEVEPPAHIRAALARATEPAPRPKPATTGRSFGGRLVMFMLGATAAVVLVAGIFAFVNRATLFGLSPAIYIAEMQSEETPFQILAGYHPDEAALVVNRSAGEVPEGRVLQLWLIAPGADAPASLGVLPDEPSVTLTIPEEFRDILRGSILAISDEPPGGSPTGAPTGNVLASGPLADV